LNWISFLIFDGEELGFNPFFFFFFFLFLFEWNKSPS